MGIAEFIFLIVVGLAAFKGYRSGVASVLSRLLCMPAAYLVTLLYTKDLAVWLQQENYMYGLMAYLTAGLALFFISATVFSGVFALLHKLAFKPDGEGNNQASKVLGALVAGGAGVLVAIMGVWFYSSFNTLWLTKQGKSLPEVSKFERKVNQIAASGSGFITKQVSGDNALSQKVATLLASPAENLGRVQRISQTGLLQKVLRDTQARQALESLNPAGLAYSQAFSQLVGNADFVALAAATGLSTKPESLAQETAMQITQVWARLDAVKNDPEFIQITQDPEVKSMIEEQNFYKMMNSAKIERLLNIMGKVEAPEILWSPNGEQQAAQKSAPAREPTQVHRWVDEKGRVHYSDKKPDPIDE